MPVKWLNELPIEKLDNVKAQTWLALLLVALLCWLLFRFDQLFDNVSANMKAQTRMLERIANELERNNATRPNPARDP